MRIKRMSSSELSFTRRRDWRRIHYRTFDMQGSLMAGVYQVPPLGTRSGDTQHPTQNRGISERVPPQFRVAPDCVGCCGVAKAITTAHVIAATTHRSPSLGLSSFTSPLYLC